MMKVGKNYLLVGGRVMRYHGLYSGVGPALAFQHPEAPLSHPPVGYSAAEEHVVRELTARDREFLETQIIEQKARNLDASASEIALAEIGGET